MPGGRDCTLFYVRRHRLLEQWAAWVPFAAVGALVPVELGWNLLCRVLVGHSVRVQLRHAAQIPAEPAAEPAAAEPAAAEPAAVAAARAAARSAAARAAAALAAAARAALAALAAQATHASWGRLATG